MRKIILAVALALAPSLGGCDVTLFKQDVAKVEAAVAVVVAKVKAGAPVAAAVLKNAVDDVCANGAAINSGVQQLQSALLANGNGPKTQANIKATNAALATLNAACAAAPQAGSASSLASLLKQGWAAYMAAKGSATAATAAAANGS